MKHAQSRQRNVPPSPFHEQYSGSPLDLGPGWGRRGGGEGGEKKERKLNDFLVAASPALRQLSELYRRPSADSLSLLEDE